MPDSCEVLFMVFCIWLGSERRRTRVGFRFTVRVVTWRQELRGAGGGTDPSARADARWSVATATGGEWNCQWSQRKSPLPAAVFISRAWLVATHPRCHADW
jgi:hypothetical protein